MTESIVLQKIERELIMIRKDVEQIKEVIMEDELELEEDVIKDMEEAKKRRKVYSQDEAIKMFCR